MTGNDALSARIGMASQAAAIGAETALSMFRSTGLKVRNKGTAIYDPVTRADLDAEQIMRELIASRFPQDSIHGEEHGYRRGQNEWRWILDPVDGTKSFVIGVPLWTCLLGLMRGDIPVFGAIIQPFLDETYQGDGSKSVLRSGSGEHKLTVSKRTSLSEAVISTTDQGLFSADEAGAFEHLRRQCRFFRGGLDAYAYARLASGDIDLIVETGLKTHDVAALIPVVTGAGGSITNWRGEALSPGFCGQVIAAAGPELIEQAVAIFQHLARTPDSADHEQD